VLGRDAATLPSSAPGLSPAEAADRLARDGPNVLPAAPPPPAWRLLLGQLTHVFALMLSVGSGPAYAAGMPQLAVAVVAVVVLNGAFAFHKRRRARGPTTS
jgi:hypothetical protein